MEGSLGKKKDYYKKGLIYCLLLNESFCVVFFNGWDMLDGVLAKTLLIDDVWRGAIDFL